MLLSDRRGGVRLLAKKLKVRLNISDFYIQ
jgi:hypothetical protein